MKSERKEEKKEESKSLPSEIKPDLNYYKKVFAERRKKFSNISFVSSIDTLPSIFKAYEDCVLCVEIYHKNAIDTLLEKQILSLYDYLMAEYSINSVLSEEKQYKDQALQLLHETAIKGSAITSILLLNFFSSLDRYYNPEKADEYAELLADQKNDIDLKKRIAERYRLNFFGQSDLKNNGELAMRWLRKTIESIIKQRPEELFSTFNEWLPYVYLIYEKNNKNKEIGSIHFNNRILINDCAMLASTRLEKMTFVFPDDKKRFNAFMEKIFSLLSHLIIKKPRVVCNIFNKENISKDTIDAILPRLTLPARELFLKYFNQSSMFVTQKIVTGTTVPVDLAGLVSSYLNPAENIAASVEEDTTAELVAILDTIIKEAKEFGGSSTSVLMSQIQQAALELKKNPSIKKWVDLKNLVATIPIKDSIFFKAKHQGSLQLRERWLKNLDIMTGSLEDFNHYFKTQKKS